VDWYELTDVSEVRTASVIRDMSFMREMDSKRQTDIIEIGSYKGPWASGGWIYGHTDVWVDVMETRKEICGKNGRSNIRLEKGNKKVAGDGRYPVKGQYGLVAGW
jgi:hypothetical protein